MKKYLGDSVYAEFADGQIILTTDNGNGSTNMIYLDFETYQALLAFVDKINEPYSR
jgi:hypothetical protein